LIEVVTVVLILGVLASAAIVGFNKTKYKAEKNQAIVYLRMIRTAEKLYWGKWKTYLALADKAAMKTQLGLEITSPFTFKVDNVTATTFTVTATSDAATGSKTLILKQDGTWDPSATYTPLPTA